MPRGGNPGPGMGPGGRRRHPPRRRENRPARGLVRRGGEVRNVETRLNPRRFREGGETSRRRPFDKGRTGETTRALVWNFPNGAGREGRIPPGLVRRRAAGQRWFDPRPLFIGEPKTSRHDRKRP